MCQHEPSKMDIDIFLYDVKKKGHIMVKDFDIALFHENIEILRKLTGLGKAEFSALLGLKNAYRKEVKSIGSKILMGIKENSSGINEEWLQTYHSKDSVNIKSAGRTVHEPANPYYSPRARKDLLQMAHEILSSSTKYTVALETSTRAYHNALKRQKTT